MTITIMIWNICMDMNTRWNIIIITNMRIQQNITIMITNTHMQQSILIMNIHMNTAMNIHIHMNIHIRMSIVECGRSQKLFRDQK